MWLLPLFRHAVRQAHLRDELKAGRCWPDLFLRRHSRCMYWPFLGMSTRMHCGLKTWADFSFSIFWIVALTFLRHECVDAPWDSRVWSKNQIEDSTTHHPNSCLGLLPAGKFDKREVLEYYYLYPVYSKPAEELHKTKTYGRRVT